MPFMCIFCTFLREDISEKHPFFWAYRKLGGGHPPQFDFDTFQKVITLPKKCVVGGFLTARIDFDFILGAKTKEKRLPRLHVGRGGEGLAAIHISERKGVFSGMSSLIFNKQ